MRILTWGAAAAALLACAPVALAHEGSPNFLSQVGAIEPTADGIWAFDNISVGTLAVLVPEPSTGLLLLGGCGLLLLQTPKTKSA